MRRSKYAFTFNLKTIYYLVSSTPIELLCLLSMSTTLTTMLLYFNITDDGHFKFMSYFIHFEFVKVICI
jgi:hypothetical protein